MPAVLAAGAPGVVVTPHEVRDDRHDHASAVPAGHHDSSATHSARNERRGERAGGRAPMTTLTFDAPARLLTLNDRLHHMVRNRLTQAWRDAAAVEARRADVPKLDRAHITITFAFPTRAHRDVHNWTTTAKAIVDGLVSDYGLLPDDCDCYLTLDIRRGPKTTGGTPQIEVRIDPLDSTERAS